MSFLKEEEKKEVNKQIEYQFDLVSKTKMVEKAEDCKCAVMEHLFQAFTAPSGSSFAAKGCT